MKNNDNKETFLDNNKERMQSIIQCELFFAPILETYPTDIGRIEQ